MITIQSVFRSLNVTGKYKGFRCAAFALKLILEDEDWLANLKGKLYPRVADEFQCSPDSVESAIRYIAKKAWTLNGDELKKLAKIDLSKAPPNKEFLTILYNYIQRSGTPPQ